VKTYTPLLALTLVLLACSGQPSQSRASAPRTVAASPSAAPSAAQSGPYAVLITPPTGATYTVSLVSVDGKIAATAQASGLPALTCGGIASAVLPLPISTSNSRVYFMDARGVVHFLTPQGQTGRAATVPIGNARRSSFTVSPDDQRIAVIVSDFTGTGSSTRLYVDNLASAAHHLVYSQTGVYGLWPIGWNGGSLVVAKVNACTTGSVSRPIELHVIDPTTATRRFTIGGSSCPIDGPSTAAGTPCLASKLGSVQVRDWTGVVVRTVAPNGAPAYVSPDGTRVAFSRGTETYVEGVFIPLDVCGWIDDTHVVAINGQHQPMIVDVTTKATVPIAAQGTCAGRIPGGL
jgi:hypothetical protein